MGLTRDGNRHDGESTWDQHGMNMGWRQAQWQINMGLTWDEHGMETGTAVNQHGFNMG